MRGPRGRATAGRPSRAESTGGSLGRRASRVILVITALLVTVVLAAPFVLLLAFNYPWDWLVDLKVRELGRQVDAATTDVPPPAVFGSATRVTGVNGGCAGFFTVCADASDDYRVEVAAPVDVHGMCEDLAAQAAATGYSVSPVRDGGRDDGGSCYFRVGEQDHSVRISIDTYRNDATTGSAEPWQLTASYRADHQF